MNTDYKPVPYDEFVSICRDAKLKFSFLEQAGLHLLKEQWPDGDSYRDGFQLVYGGATVSITIEYYDMELVIWFQRNSGDRIPYLFIDHELMANHSGFHGCMFPRNKLADAVSRMAEDIRLHYSHILTGDDDIWIKLLALLHAPREKKKIP